MPDNAGEPVIGPVAWLVAALGYLVLEAVAAYGFGSHYSYARNYISDLGIPSESPLAYLMNTAFWLQGTLFLVGAVLIVGFSRRRAGRFLALTAANAVGNIMVAVVHSGPTAHADGTVWVHDTGAVLAILGGNAAIAAGSAVISGTGTRAWYRRASAGLAVLGVFSFAMLVLEMTVPAIGVLPGAVLERASVYSITGWQLLSAAYLLVRRNQSPD